MQQPASFVLHFGDLGYALGNHWIWDQWGSMIADGASRLPYMVSPGNHEMDYSMGGEHDPSKQPPFQPEWWHNGREASQGECGVPMYYRFAAPPTGNSVFWYSFVWGNTAVVQMSSEHDFQPGSPQYQWLETTLLGVNRNVTPWLIVTLHRPIYTTQECELGDYVVSLHLRRALDPLFDKYQVNLVLVGHTHSYERTCPVMNEQCGEDGTAPVHITVGSAGAGLESCGYSPAYGNFSRAHVNTWGYLRVRTHGSSHMHLQFVLDVDGSVYDEAMIKPWLPFRAN